MSLFLRKFVLIFAAAAFCLGLGASSSTYAQRGRYWHHDNGRHLGWYKHGRDRRVRTVIYRSHPRYYVRGRRYVGYYPRYYVYPRYGYTPLGYAPYYVREGYPMYPRSGLSINLNFRFSRHR